VNRPTKLLALALPLSLAVACGGSKTGGPGNIQNKPTTLRITTLGDGLVRGGTDAGDCRGTCTTLMSIGSEVQLKAIPDQGASFVGWTGACNGPGSCKLTLSHETAVTATFNRPIAPPGSHRLTVVVDGSGKVTSSPAGLECDSTTCSADFSQDSAITLNATPAQGFVFDGWSGGPCAGTGACAIAALRDDLQITARFTKHPPQEIHLAVAVSGPGQVKGGAIDCGLPPALTCDATVPPGSSVTLTAFPATQTRFMGWGGACTGNAPTCTVVATEDTQVSAAFEFETQTLVANDGTNMAVLAINGTHAFFGRRSADGSSAIWSVPKTGGIPSPVSPGVPLYIVADDGFVYWTDGVGLYSVPVAGGSASQLAISPQMGRLALDDAGALYWVDVAAAGRSGAVHRMQDRVSSTPASGQQPTGAIAVDSSFVYFSDAGPAGAAGAIRRVPVTPGGAVETVANTPAEVVALRVDPLNIYFRDTTGAVFTLRKAGGAALLLSGPNIANGNAIGPLDIDANASVVWWTWMDSTGGPTKGLFHANADGIGFTAVDTGSDLAVWSGPRVDDGAVYYFHAGSLLKRLK
jgi:hypothetical protein